MPTDVKPTSESDPFQPAGLVIDQEGKDVSARDRSDDGTIIIRRNREVGHNYRFGQWPEAPWKKPKEIELSQGEVAVVEARDFGRVNKLKWHYRHNHNHRGSQGPLLFLAERVVETLDQGIFWHFQTNFQVVPPLIVLISAAYAFYPRLEWRHRARLATTETIKSPLSR